MPGGNVGAGVATEFRNLDAIGEVEPADAGAYVRVGAGVVAADLDRLARSHGYFLPPLPSSAPWCTLGGMVANNAAGARSFGYGVVRDWLDEIDVVLGDGSLHRITRDQALPEVLCDLHDTLDRRSLPTSWPDVRKNSSGYGLDRFIPQRDPVALFAGSEGTLGVITGARVRLAPLPRARAIALLRIASHADLPAMVDLAESAGAIACEFLGRRFLEIAGLEHRPDVGPLAAGAEALLMVELDGRTRPVPAGMEILRREARGAGVEVLHTTDAQRADRLWSIRHAASPIIARQAEQGRVSMQFIEDSVVPRTRLPAYLDHLQAILTSQETDAVMFGHAGDGNAHVNPLIDVTRPDWRSRVRTILEETATLVASLGGTLTGEHGDGRIRAPYLERIWGPGWADAFRTVKSHLDGRGILNPGVVIPDPGQDPLDGLSPEPRGRPQ